MRFSRSFGACCVLMFFCMPVGANEEEGGLKPGDSPPAFSLLDVNGKQVALDDLRGKTILLNFWAFWCDTWKEEMPHLRRLAARQEELGFHLVAVSVDGTRVPEFMRLTRGDVPFPVLLDVGGKVSAQYGVAHVPTVVLIDKEARVRFVKPGYPGNQVILNELRKLTMETNATKSASKAEVARPKRREGARRQKQ